MKRPAQFFETDSTLLPTPVATATVDSPSPTQPRSVLVSTPASPASLLAQASELMASFHALELAGRPGVETAELVLAAHRLANQVHGALLTSTAAFDASGAWEADGAATSAAWLRAHADLAPGTARGLVRDARLARDVLPNMAQALSRGDVSPAHVRVVSAIVDRYPERRDTIAQVEPSLVEAACHVDPPTLRVLVERWTAAVDPQVAVDDDADRHAARALSASRTLDGMVAIDGLLDPDNGAAVLTALDALMRADRDPDDDRLPKQRRADALGEIARRALDAGTMPTSGGERPHVLVTIPIAVVLDQASSGATIDAATPMSADAAWRYLCDATLVPILEGTPGQVLDIGRATRTIPPSLRRAVVRRDLHCVFAGCDAPPQRCEVHHLVEWSHGGSTSLDNCVLLCRRHHRAVHQEGFVLLGSPDDELRTIRPDGTRVPDAFARRRDLLRRPPEPPHWSQATGTDPP